MKYKLLNNKAPYEIIYEDDNLLVVYKKRNLLSIKTSDPKTFFSNLYHYIYLYLRKKKENPYIVNRLDYETSGIVVFTKSYKYKELLQSSFERREVERDYEAIVAEKLPQDYSKRVVQYLKENSSFKVVEAENKDDGKEAITNIAFSNYTLIGTVLKINIETGRRNQIRLALKSLGLTLLGDTRYSGNQAKRLYLNSYKLVFPTSLGLKESTFEVDPLWIH